MSAAKLLSNFNPSTIAVLTTNRSSWPILKISYRGYRPPNWKPTIVQPHGPWGNRPNRHTNEKFSHMRAKKVIKVDLSVIPDYESERERTKTFELGLEEMRTFMKKKGLPPVRPYRDRGRDRPIHVSSTGSVIEKYVPPEGDGRASRLSREGVGQLWDQISAKSKELIMHARRVRRYDEEFDPKTFGEVVALPVFIDAHKALVERDIDRLHELVTEHAFSIMHEENRLRSIRWEFVESIEPARVVHIRAMPVLQEDNMFGQVTVRMHTKQKLAIYDQFGRLALGSPDIGRDVLEYVVFERHLVDIHGSWRLHAKIVPEWLPPRDAAIRTFKKKDKAKKHDVPDDLPVEKVLPVKDDESEIVPLKGGERVSTL